MTKPTREQVLELAAGLADDRFVEIPLRLSVDDRATIALALRLYAETMGREGGKLAWTKGTYTTTDGDGGPMEGVPRHLEAWRAGPYTIIKQEGPDGMFILRGTSNGIGQVMPSLKDVQDFAQADYVATSPPPAPGYAEGLEAAAGPCGPWCGDNCGCAYEALNKDKPDA